MSIKVYGNEKCGYITNKKELLDNWDMDGIYYEGTVTHEKVIADCCKHIPEQHISGLIRCKKCKELIRVKEWELEKPNAESGGE